MTDKERIKAWLEARKEARKNGTPPPIHWRIAKKNGEGS
jgi:hypothetical protein